MADTKISALTSASTPLAGTEVLPVVQSGVTKKVTVADLTAGRDVTAKSLTVPKIGGGITLPNAVWLGSGYGLGYLLTGDTSANYVDFYMGFANLQINANKVTLKNQTDTTTYWTFNSTGNVDQGAAAKGINFTANTPAAGMTSQLLNWYEEGTWTPTLSASGGGSTTYLNQYATYSRIGNRVFVDFWLMVANAGTLSGNLFINGFPFAHGSSSSRPGAMIKVNTATITGQAACWMPNANALAQLDVINNGTSTQMTQAALNAGTEFYGNFSYTV